MEPTEEDISDLRQKALDKIEANGIGITSFLICKIMFLKMMVMFLCSHFRFISSVLPLPSLMF